MDVLVIGAAGLDVKARVAGALQVGTSKSGVIQRSPGGVARNVAETLARLGVEVTFVSAVGEGWSGEYVLERARQAGVDCSHVLVQPDLRTGTYLAVQDQGGRLIFALDDMAALEAITPRYLHDRRRLFRDAQMIMIDANLTPAALSTVFRLAEQYDRPVCADPTSTPLAARLRPFLNQLNLTTPNFEEAGAMLEQVVAGTEPIAAARQLVSKGVGLAIITLAEQGLCYATTEESGHLPALSVTVVDPTGAGDALTAAIIFGLLEELPASEAVRLGLSAAALTLQCRETVCMDLSLERLYEQLIV